VEILKEMITPNQAAIWLKEKNTKNRKMHRPHVIEFKNIIDRGDWQVLPILTIAFDIDGILIDGQHRLAAIAEGDISVAVYVARGTPSDAMLATTEKGRSASDILTVYRGVKSVFSSTAMITAAVRFGRKEKKVSRRLSPNEILYWYDKMADTVSFVLKCTGNSARPTSSPVLSVGVRAIMCGESEDVVGPFFRCMRSNLPVDGFDCSPPLSLSRQIMSYYGSGKVPVTKNLVLLTENALFSFINQWPRQVIRARGDRLWLIG